MKANSDELQSFVSVVDSGSISAAAEQMGLTASAVSRTLSRLEHKLGTTLLNRTTRRMELTEEGRYFLDQARQILQQMEALEERLALRRQSPAAPADQRRLALHAARGGAAHRRVPPAVPGHPARTQHQRPDHRPVGATHRRGDPHRCAQRLHPARAPLGASRLHILASPEYLARHGTPASIEGLRGHTLLGFTQPEHLNRWPVVHADGDRLEIQPDISASSGETLRQLVLSHQGIACLASFMTDRDIQDGRLVPLFAEQMSEYRQPIHAVYYRNSQLALRIQCFLDFIQQRLGA